MGQLTQINPALINDITWVDTTDNWIVNNTVPGLGIICIERSATRSKIKIGDGVRVYRELPDYDTTDNPITTYTTTLLAGSTVVTLPFEYDTTNINIMVFVDDIKQLASSITFTDNTHITLPVLTFDVSVEVVKLPKSIGKYTEKRDFNYIVDGNFDFWYEGTSLSINGYGSTMWFLWSDPTLTKTMSRQSFALGDVFPDGVPCPKYYTRLVTTAGSVSSSACCIYHHIEDITRLAGRTVTIRFYARADDIKNMGVEIIRNCGTGGTPTGWASTYGKLIQITPQWTLYTITLTIPGLSGATLGTDGNSSAILMFYVEAGSDYDQRSGGVGHQSGTFDIAKVSLVVGDHHFKPLERSLQEEETLVNRYYQRICDGTGVADRVAHGTISSANRASLTAKLKTPMRLMVPTVTINTLSSLGVASGVTGSVCSAFILAGGATNCKIGIITFAMDFVTAATVTDAATLYVITTGVTMSLDARI